MSVITLLNGGKIELDHVSGETRFFPWSSEGELFSQMDDNLTLGPDEPHYTEILQVLIHHLQRWAEKPGAGQPHAQNGDKLITNLDASESLREWALR